MQSVTSNSFQRASIQGDNWRRISEPQCTEKGYPHGEGGDNENGTFVTYKGIDQINKYNKGDENQISYCQRKKF